MELRRLNLALVVLLCGSSVFGDTGGYSINNWPTTYQCNVTDFPSSYPVTGSVSVSNLPATQPVSGTFWQATQPISGSLSVSNFPASQAVTGTFWQSIQPVSQSGAWSVSPGTGTYPVSGTFWQATQPVSGTFWQATQPVSVASMPTTPVSQSGSWSVSPGTGVYPVGGSVSVSNLPATQAVSQSGAFVCSPGTGTYPVAGTVSVNTHAVTQSGTWTVSPGTGTQPVSIASMPSTPVTGTFWQATQPIYTTNTSTMTQVISSTGAAAVATNVAIPAAGAGLFQYITQLEIELYTTSARTGGATPVNVTSSNLPGSMQWFFASAGAVGTDEDKNYTFPQPLRASSANTATVIKLPSTTSGAWIVNVTYYTGP